MGVEHRTAALDPGWGLVELARRDREHGASLGMIPIWFADPAGRPDRERDGDPPDRVWRAACRLAGERRDLPARVLDLDRRFDLLHWLLSAARRDDPPAAADAVLDRLFGTGTPVADHVRATQGRPVVHVPAGVVRAAADALARVWPGDLTRRYDPARLADASVYKYVAAHHRDADWLAVAMTDLCRLRAFVAAAAGRGDELVVVID